jgi:hypothetical protein
LADDPPQIEDDSSVRAAQVPAAPLDATPIDLVIGGPGVWIGNTLIRIASRRRRKVKVHVFPQRSGIRVEGDPPLESARENEIERQPEDSIERSGNLGVTNGGRDG